MRIRRISSSRRSAIGADRAQGRVAVVVLAHPLAYLALELEDLDDSVGYLEAAVLPTALAAGDDHDRLPRVDHLLDPEAELADGRSPLRPVLLDALVPPVGAGVGVVGGRDPLDVVGHVLEHPPPIA